VVKRITFGLKNRCLDGITLYSSIVIVGLAINAAVVGLIIFPQGRYMAYATGMFYSSLVLMLGELFIKQRKEI
jgi:hypothetical protein